MICCDRRRKVKGKGKVMMERKAMGWREKRIDYEKWYRNRIERRIEEWYAMIEGGRTEQTKEEWWWNETS